MKDFILYSVDRTGNIYLPYKDKFAKLSHKNIYVSSYQQNFTPTFPQHYQQFSFEYSYKIPFNLQIPKGETINTFNILKTINTSITYNDGINNKTYYTHLTCIHRLINSYRFKRLWILQEANIKWIIGIVITIILGYKAVNIIIRIF